MARWEQRLVLEEKCLGSGLLHGRYKLLKRECNKGEGRREEARGWERRQANKGTELKVRDNRKQYVQMSFMIAEVRWESMWQN